MTTFLRELRRRNVFRVAGVYAVVGWLLLQVSATLENAMGLPGWFDGMVVSLLLIGLPVALVLACAGAFELGRYQGEQLDTTQTTEVAESDVPVDLLLEDLI